MTKHRIYTTSFASVYPLYVAKAEKKGRTRDEVDQIVLWLTGYSPDGLAAQIARKSDFVFAACSARFLSRSSSRSYSLRDRKSVV